MNDQPRKNMVLRQANCAVRITSAPCIHHGKGCWVYLQEFNTRNVTDETGRVNYDLGQYFSGEVDVICDQGKDWRVGDAWLAEQTVELVIPE